MPSSPEHPDEPARQRDVLGLALILAALTAFAPFATDMYLAGFPLLAKSFDTDLASIQLGLSVFFLGLGLGQLIYGPVIDRYGRKGPLLAGVGLFVVASALIAAAPNAGTFIALRFLQAIGGAAGLIVSRAIIADLFSQREAARVFSLMMMVQALGPIIAPVMGGYLVAYLGWQAVFVFLSLFGLACLAAVQWGLAETLPPEQRRRESAAAIAGAFGRLVTTRDFIVPVLTGSCVLAALFVFLTGSPFVYMVLHGVAEQNFGWLFAVNAGGLIIAAQANRILLKRLPSVTVASGGIAVMALAAAALALLAGTAPLPLLVALVFVCLANVPLITANTVSLALAAAGPHRGSGSAIVGLLQFAIAGGASATLGLLHDGTARPMGWMIFACAGLGALLWFAARGSSPAAPAQPRSVAPPST